MIIQVHGQPQAAPLATWVQQMEASPLDVRTRSRCGGQPLPKTTYLVPGGMH